MATEQNEEHRLAGTCQLPAGRILDAAGHLCAVQLISGVIGYTLNNDVIEGDYISLDGDSPLSIEDSRGALSTKLFKGEGQSRYSPVHRHISEFLGARHLAALIKPWAFGEARGLADRRRGRGCSNRTQGPFRLARGPLYEGS